MEPSSADQAKARAKHVFTVMAPTYDQGGPAYFSRFGERLVEFAGIAPSRRVLDVATGRGALLFPSAQVVGSHGSVTGIDLSHAMIDATQAEVDDRASTNVTLQIMDAEQLEFPDAAFDAVLCGFALMFFPRLDQALSEFHRVLAPGGVLAASTFVSDLGTLTHPVMSQYTQDIRRPLSQPLSSADELRGVYSNAGFTEIEVQTETLDIVYPDIDSYWSWHMGLLTGVWFRGQPPEVQQSFEADVREYLATLLKADGLHESIAALFARGVRP